VWQQSGPRQDVQPGADGAVAVFIGGRDHARSWDWVAEELRHDWHIIAPDLRGHGDSAWSPDGSYEMSTFVYDMAQ
jgi:pimeloyl-ACP methyl ester carboxylesterase